MNPEGRNEKVEALLTKMDHDHRTIKQLEKRIENRRESAKANFEKLAELCPGRSPRSDRENEFTLRSVYDCCKEWDCNAVGGFCEYENCPMVQKGHRYNWGNGEK